MLVLGQDLVDQTKYLHQYITVHTKLKVTHPRGSGAPKILVFSLGLNFLS